MRRSVLFCFVALALLALLAPIGAEAKPKRKTYNNSPEQVFLAAIFGKP